MDDSGEGLIYGLVLDGSGGAHQIGLDEVAAWAPEQGILWLHFDYTSVIAREWITEHANVDEIADGGV